MGAGFKVTPSELREASSSFSVAATDLASAIGTLTSTLSGLGAFWGDDDQGAKFAAAYQPHAGQVERAADNVMTGLQSISEGLSGNADNHEQTDAGNSTRFGAR